MPTKFVACAAKLRVFGQRGFTSRNLFKNHVNPQGSAPKKFFPILLAIYLAVFVCFTFLMETNVCALDLEKAKEFYLQMLSNAHPYAKEVTYEINYDLPLYRFWKVFTVGSVEWAESTKKTGDYLSYLRALKPENEEFADEMELARTIYLSYQEAVLSLKPFSTSLVKNSTLFNDFFRDYQFRLSEAFGNYAQDLTAYLLGAEIDVPYVPEELKKLRTRVIEFRDYTPQYKGEEGHAIGILMSTPELVVSITEAIAGAKEQLEKTQVPDSELVLTRTRGLILRSALNQIAGLKDIIADEFVKVTPKRQNFLPLRWVAYLIFFVVWFLAFRRLDIPLMLFVASETIYLATLSNILSTGDGMIYGIAAGVAVLFAIPYFLYKREWSWFVLTLAALVMLFVPTFSTRDLLMNRDFTRSPFYEALKNDILYDPLGTVQRALKNYNTLLNDSVQSYTELVHEILPEGELEVALSEEYLELPAQEKRLAFVKGLKQLDRNAEELIRDFVFFEEGRIRKARSELSKMKSVLSRALIFSSQDFREELRNFIEKNFEGQAQRELLGILKSTKQASAITLSGYQLRTTLYAFVMIFFAVFLRILKRPEWLILALGAFALSVLSFVGPQQVFVQYGVPTLELRGTTFNPAALVISVILGVAWLRENTILRRRERA